MTKNIESILIPINDAPTSLAAFTLAKKMGAETLELFHEVERWPNFVNEILFPYAGLGEDRDEIDFQILSKARNYYEEKFRIKKHDTLHLNFLDRESTKSRLQSSAADLVILGDDRDKEKGRIGAYAESVVGLPIKPTLLVRDKKPIKKILVAIDLSESSSRILNFSAQLAFQTQAQMETLVVIPDGNDDVRELLQLNTALNRKKLIGKCRSRIEAMFERTTQNQDLKFGSYDQLSPMLKRKTIRVGEPAETIINYADSGDADLIVLGVSRHSGRVGSISHKVIRDTHRNVLIIN